MYKALAGLIIFILILSGCNDYAFHSESKEVPNMALDFREYVPFEFVIADSGMYHLSLNLAFIEDQVLLNDKIATENVEVYFILKGPGPDDVVDEEYNFKLKDELGWRGKKTGKEGERELMEKVWPSVEMMPGNYVLKVFSNAVIENTEYFISGIPRLTFEITPKK